MVTTIVTMADNNTFSFNMCILKLYLTSRRKPNFFSNSVKRNTFSTFEFIAVKVVSAAFLLACFLILNKNACQTRKYVFYFNSKALFVLEKVRS